MADTQVINDKVYWVNPQGALIPQERVKKEDQIKEELLDDISTRWADAQTALRQLKAWIYSEVGAYLILIQEQYGAPPRKAEGLTLKDFTGRRKLEIKVASLIDFDERLQVAKGLIDQCIDRWSENSDQNLVTVIKDAFRVNQEGRVSIPRILGLRRLNIADKDWQQAMTAITDSVIVEHTKKYIRLYQRSEDEGKWIALPLDLASL